MNKLEFEDITFGYTDKSILDRVSFSIKRGEFVLLNGPSGTGKTTLINLLAGLLKPFSGNIYWGDRVLFKDIETSEIDRLRNRVIGIHFQDYRLIPHLSGWENITLPALVKGYPKEDTLIKELARVMFASDYQKILKKKTSSLSGGERERVSIIRAFSLAPPFILADEMLNSLDYELQEKIWNIIKNGCQVRKISLFLVSHNEWFFKEKRRDFDKIFKLERGQLEEA